MTCRSIDSTPRGSWSACRSGSGSRDYHLARRLIADDINAYRAPRTKREREYQCRRLKDLLDELAKFWGFASPTN